jgi:hypothetical protein
MKPVLSAGVLSMPVGTYVVLRRTAEGRKLLEAAVSGSDEWRLQGLVEAGLVMRRDRTSVATDAGEQVVQAVTRVLVDDKWPADGFIRVDVKALGW